MTICINCKWLKDEKNIEDFTYGYVCKFYHCIIEDPEVEMECPEWCKEV